jgi:hypothetical protein
MAAFKVGQRVKRKPIRCVEVPPGDEGTIMELNASVLGERAPYHRVLWDKAGEWNTAEDCLAPLTDPRAQEFIEDMERFSRVTRKVPAGDELPSLREVIEQQMQLAARNAP